MNRYQADVEAFHRALDIPIGHSPAIRRPDLRAELIMEEAVETVEAITGRRVQWRIYGHPGLGKASLVEAIDGMVDIIVVTLGSAVEFGIDLDPFWDEVHRSNMAKVGGPTREDGKKLKPPGWTPPDIEGILTRYQDAS